MESEDLEVSTEWDTKSITDAAKEVYKELGTGHTEIVYETALEIELLMAGWSNIRRQVPCPIFYKDFSVGTGYIDILVNDIYVIELKTVTKISPKDEVQLKKYLSEDQCGLLINFSPYDQLEVVKICE